MKAKLIPIAATLCAIATLLTVTFALRAGEDARTRQECLEALVRPHMAPDDPTYGAAWVAYSADVKMCMEAP